MRYTRKVYCDHCTEEIEPGEKFYVLDGEAYHAECFVEICQERESEYIRLNTDEYAEKIGASVVER